MQELFAKFKRDIRKKKKKKDISLGNLYVRVWALKGSTLPLHAITKSLREVTKAH